MISTTSAEHNLVIYREWSLKKMFSFRHILKDEREAQAQFFLALFHQLARMWGRYFGQCPKD